MSKVRNLPETTTLADDDLLYAVNESAGPNGGRKIKKSNLKLAVAQSAAEIKTAYESNADTNAFTDAEKTKLGTVEAGAAFQNADEVPFDNVGTGLSATEVQSAIEEVNIKAGADFLTFVVSGRILHYTAGSARFDGVYVTVTGGDILLNSSITDGEVYLDLDGFVKQTGSGILSPPFTVVFARFSTDLNDITSLTDIRVKNAQNIVRGILSDVKDIRAGAAASEGSSGRISDAMHKHNILTAAPSSQSPDQSNTEGSSISLARADHAHEIPTDAPTTNLSPATTNSEGSGTSFARNDHTHALTMAQAGDLSTVNAGDAENLGSVDRLVRADHQHPVATAAASSLDANSSNTEGSSTNLARADHTHDLATGIPSSQTPDQSNAEGSSANLARADHIHNIPADAPTINLSPATANSEGSGSSFSRNDHTHALEMAQAGDLSTVNAGDAENLGSINRLVKADHQHPVATAVPVAQTPDQSNAEGVSTSLARADHIHNIPTAIAVDVSTANAQGSAATLSRADHVHKGLHSINANAGTQRFGDVSLSSGSGATVTDNGSGTFTIETVLGGNELYVTQGSGLTANYTAGRVRINGTTYSIVASSIVVVTGATNGRIYVDVDGIVKSTTATTTPANGVPLAIFSSSGVAITALSDNRSVLKENIQFGASGDIANLNATNVAAAGSTNKYADAGHVHTISTAAPSTQNPDQANAVGTSASLARADHIHNIPADAPTTTLSPATTNSEGSGTSFSRNDHTHAVQTGLVGDITTIQPDDAAAAGTVDKYARADHKHAIVAAAPSNTGTANSEGSGTSFARNDHVHDTTIANSAVKATAGAASTSGTDVLITSMTLTPAAGTYLALFEGAAQCSNNTATISFSIYVGGSQNTNSERGYIPTNAIILGVASNAIVTVNGSQAVEVRYRTTAGTVTANGRSLTLIRLGA